MIVYEWKIRKNKKVAIVPPATKLSPPAKRIQAGLFRQPSDHHVINLIFSDN